MKAADCLAHEIRAAIRKRDGLVAVRTGWEDEKGDRLCSTSKLQGEVGCYPLRSLSGDDWEPMVAQAEVDKLQTRVAELEAENEAMRSGEAFVGEAYDEGDLICEDNFFWNRNVDGMLHLHVCHFNDPADPRNQYPYTGPTTAPLPNDTCNKLKDPDATLKKPAEKFKADDPPEDTTPPRTMRAPDHVVKAAESGNLLAEDTTPLPELIDGDYSREMLIAICEAGVVPHAKWMNRDTPEAHAKLGLCWVMLKAGCEFTVTLPVDEVDERSCVTDDRTIWLYVKWDSFATVDHGGPAEEQHFYLPTPKRLRERVGGDWY